MWIVGGVDWWKHDNCFQKWATVDTYSTALSNGSYPNTEATIAKFLNDQSWVVIVAVLAFLRVH